MTPDTSKVVIRIGVWGRILSGEDVGKQVRIDDDKASSGGYLVLVKSDLNPEEGHDSWVEKYDDLLRYFIEAEWAVAWME